MTKGINRLRYLLLAATGLLIGLGLYLTNAEIIGRDPMPMPFGIGIAVVTTGSMEPSISVNDLIFVRDCEDYEEGDIAVYRRGNSLVVHRIVKITENEVILKGDANNVSDEATPTRSLKGKVFFYVPALGLLLRFIKSGPGILTLITVGVLLIEVPYRRKERKDGITLEEIRQEIERLKEEEQGEDNPLMQ